MNHRTRAFTLVEVVLASLIGSLVIIAAVGVFAAMNATDTRHKARVRQTNEISLGYRVMERCFQLLVMEDAAPVADADARTRIERDLQRADGMLEDDDGADLEKARLLLIADSTAPGMMPGPTRPIRPQLVRLALRAPALAGGLPTTDARTTLSAFNSPLVPPSFDRNERGRRSDRRPVGRTTDPAGEFEEEWDAEELPAARAPGVRAELILLPDGSEPESEPMSRSAAFIGGSSGTYLSQTQDEEGQGWTLWYREIPARTGADHLTPAERQAVLNGDTSILENEIDPADLYYRPDPTSFRRVPLITGIRTLEWRVFRRSRFVNQLAAIAARELPAYVEVTIELLNGRRENWMFEVAWTTGPEPGSLLAQGADPLDLAGDPLTNPDGTPTTPDPSGVGGTGGEGTGGDGNGGAGTPTNSGPGNPAAAPPTGGNPNSARPSKTPKPGTGQQSNGGGSNPPARGGGPATPTRPGTSPSTPSSPWPTKDPNWNQQDAVRPSSQKNKPR